MAGTIKDFPNLPPAVQELIYNGPALTPPDGVTPNFKNPSNRNGEALAVVTLCLVCSTIVTVGRAYSRIFISKKVELQDYLGLAAYASYIVLVWVYLDFLNIAGFSVHQWNVTFRDIIPISKILTFGLTISYSATLLFAKSAILLEWIRVFSPHRIYTFFYRSCYLMIVLNILLYVSSIISSAITCLPHESIWHPWVDGKCIDRKALGLFTAFFNVIMDLLILLLPQRIIWTLQMTKARRLGISVVFSMGVLATVCAAGRVAATFAIDYDGDATYTASDIMLWAVPELTCVLLVFCMPSVPKALAKEGPIFKVVSAVRSWTLLPTTGSRTSEGSISARSKWPTIGRQSKTRVYRTMDHPDDQSIRMAQLGLTHTESHKLDEQQLRDQPPPVPPLDPAIMRTMEVQQHRHEANGFPNSLANSYNWAPGSVDSAKQTHYHISAEKP